MDAKTRATERARASVTASPRVSRKLPPTIQNRSTAPSAACETISAAVQPGASGTGNPHTAVHRAARFGV